MQVVPQRHGCCHRVVPELLQVVVLTLQRPPQQGLLVQHRVHHLQPGLFLVAVGPGQGEGQEPPHLQVDPENN